MNFVPNFLSTTPPKQFRERLRRIVGGFHRLRRLKGEERAVVLDDAARKLNIPRWLLS